MALGINNVGLNLFNPQTSGIIPGDELAKVARQIFSEPVSESYVNPFGNTSNNNGIEKTLFSAGYDVNAVKQAATNQAGLNLNLSDNALSAINSLKAKAVQDQIFNLQKVVDGKIHVNVEKVDISENKSIFAMSNSPQVMESKNLFNDRRGPGGFYFPNKNEDEEQDENSGLNLVI